MAVIGGAACAGVVGDEVLTGLDTKEEPQQVVDDLAT